jgi:beta-glucosidase
MNIMMFRRSRGSTEQERWGLKEGLVNRREFAYTLTGAGALLSDLDEASGQRSGAESASQSAEGAKEPAGGEAPDYRDARLPIGQRVRDLLKRMTIDEKVEQIAGGFRNRGILDTTGRFNDESAREAFRQLYNMQGHLGARDRAVLRNAVQRYQLEKTRLGIPALSIGEGLHAFMENGGTSFPQAIGLASTWDPLLVREVFTAVADEMSAVGVNQAFAPVVDLGREPRWGRTEESFGEDPYFAARMGVAAVRGFQGDNFMIDRHHVLSTLKHFVAYGGPEGGRNEAPANYAER